MRKVLVVLVAGVVGAGCAGPQIVHDRSGARTRLDDLKGRAVVLTFWADDCKPCLDQMPVVMSSVALHGDQVVFVPVFVREKPGHDLDGWLGNQPEWFRAQICWANEPFLRGYDRTVMPRTYVYGRNGRVVEQFDGRIDQARARLLEASLLRALAAKE